MMCLYYVAGAESVVPARAVTCHLFLFFLFFNLVLQTVPAARERAVACHLLRILFWHLHFHFFFVLVVQAAAAARALPFNCL